MIDPLTSGAGREELLVISGAGPRATETILLHSIRDLLSRADQFDPESLPNLPRQPIRVIVPSRSLANHLAATIARHFNRGVVGVAIHTLNGYALTMLRETGLPVPANAPLFGVFAKRLAADKAALSRVLDHLSDGYASVLSTLRDLLDAGVTASQVEDLVTALNRFTEESRHPFSEAAIERARSLIEVAGETALAVDREEIGLSTTGLRRAARLHREHPELRLDSHARFIYGFADATGAAIELIREILSLDRTTLILDLPPKPGATRTVDSGDRFALAFAARVSESPTLLKATRFDTPSHSPSVTGDSVSRKPKLFHAPGGHAEIREVCYRIRALLDAGAVPERIAIVARQLDGYRAPLSLHLGRLAIPFSSPGARGPLLQSGRRAQAVVELLRSREATTTDRWLGARPRETGRFDLSLALRALGAGRLADVAALDLHEILGDRKRFSLPVRRGLWSREREEFEDPEPADTEPRAYRRSVSAKQLKRLIDEARSLVAILQEWSHPLPFSEHVDKLRNALTDGLGWTDKTEGSAVELYEVLTSLKEQITSELPLEPQEFTSIIAGRFADFGRRSLGGEGGGVQVLDVTAARSITFDHLFLVGLNRDVFPRSVREDPMLADPLRRPLRELIPDLALKAHGHKEERFLFAQLLASSPRVTISWQSTCDDGRSRAASPLVERLILSSPDESRLTAVAIPPIYASTEARGRDGADPHHPLLKGLPLLPAHEEAIHAGLFATRRHFRQILEIAVKELEGQPTRGRSRSIVASALAESRVAVLSELDPDLRTADGRSRATSLGPYLGFLGPTGEKDDPRRGRLFVTTMESAARCPWSTLLERLLRIEPSPDPLEALPAVDALMIGSVVHAVLEAIVRNADPELDEDNASLEAVKERRPVQAPWPDEKTFELMLEREARRIIKEEGVPLRGLERVLIERARPLLEQARDLDWKSGAASTLGAEILGHHTIEVTPTENIPLYFKADRVDRENDRLLLTDYKTGRPISDKKKPETRFDHYLDQVRAGEKLQAIAYALAGGSQPARGRYLFLKETLAPDTREAIADSESLALVQAYDQTVKSILGAWSQGAFFPRLIDLNSRREPKKCKWCPVAEACLRGDSGVRRRLTRWIEPHDPNREGWSDSLSPLEQSLVRLFRIQGSERRRNRSSPVKGANPS